MVRRLRAEHTETVLPQVTISSDDPAVFGISLTSELQIAASSMGYDEDALRALMENAIGAAFLPDGPKGALRERLAAAWSAWRVA